MFLDPAFKPPSPFSRKHAEKAFEYLIQQVLEEVRQYGTEYLKDVSERRVIVRIELATPTWSPQVVERYKNYFMTDNATTTSWPEGICIAAHRLPEEIAALAKGAEAIAIDTGCGPMNGSPIRTEKVDPYRGFIVKTRYECVSSGSVNAIARKKILESHRDMVRHKAREPGFEKRN
jgi:ribosomal protein S14